MSSNGKRVRKPEPYVASKRATFQPGDEIVGEYTRERLLKTNDRFVERVERAIANGDERPASGARAMLALTDGALARLCIGATRIRQHRRGRWLK